MRIEVFGCAYSKYLFIQRSGIDIKGDVLKANYMLKLTLELCKEMEKQGQFLWKALYVPIHANIGLCFLLLYFKSEMEAFYWQIDTEIDR